MAKGKSQAQATAQSTIVAESKQQKEKTKAVVRKLPPALTEDHFKAALEKVCAPTTYDWFCYFPGKISNKRVVFSRAYINFIHAEDLYDFKSKFDGHLFVGSRGNQYRAAVEYAPFQKVPTTQPKKHNTQGTIDKDPDFQAFLALYEAGEESLPSAAAQREARERDKGAGSIATAPGPQTTHLLTYLQAKYAEGGRIGSARGARKGGRAGAGGADASGPMSLLKAPSRTKAKGDVAVPAAAAAAAAAATTAALKGKQETRSLKQAGTRQTPSSSKHEPAPTETDHKDPKHLKQSRQAPTKTTPAAEAAAAAASAAAAAVSASKAALASDNGERGKGRAAGGNASANKQTKPAQKGSLVEKAPPPEAPKLLLTRPAVKDAGAAAGLSAPPGLAQPSMPPGLKIVHHPHTAVPAPAPAPAAADAHGAGASASSRPASTKPAVKPGGRDRDRDRDRDGGQSVKAGPAESKPVSASSHGKGHLREHAAPPSSSASTTPSNNAASAAAAAATTAAAPSRGAVGAAASANADSGLPSRKVRAGFQAYVPGALRPRPGQSTAEGGG